MTKRGPVGPVVLSRRPVAAWWLLVALSLLAVACAGSEVPESARAQPVQIRPTTGPDASPTPIETGEPGATPEPEGQSTPTFESTPEPIAPSPGGSWAADRNVGDCFNNAASVGGEPLAGPMTNCDFRHEYEIFLLGDSSDPADADFPTSPAFSQRLFDEFCEPAAQTFAGAPIDQLPFEVAIWTPTEVDWNAGDRRYACVAAAGLPDENRFKVGTAAGGDLTTDDGIVARGTVDGQRDLYFSFQRSTLYPLTHGTYDLPNVAPDVLPVGLLFASSLQDVDFIGNFAYDYNFESGQITRLETGLDGWEVASPHFIFDPPAFLFAARESDEDDWNLFSTRTADDFVQLTDGDGDEKWPTLTPDQSQILYHADDDVWIMNVDGSDQRQLTTDAGGDFEAAVSPDGTQVVFASDRSGSDDIWIMNIDGSDQRNLTNHPADEAWPFFSADSSLVYFQTDRLGVSSSIMVMEADGSNPSYFSTEFMTNGALLPPDVTARFIAELPTIAEVLEGRVEGVVPGAVGDQSLIAHTSGRLRARLPSGWEFEERDTTDAAVLVAAESVAVFDTSWFADGAMITVIEATASEFEARQAQAGAPTDETCELQSQSDGQDGDRSTSRAEYSCGEAGTAVVVAVFQADAGVGVLFEGQYDSQPDSPVDQAMINAISETLTWG